MYTNDLNLIIEIIFDNYYFFIKEYARRNGLTNDWILKYILDIENKLKNRDFNNVILNAYNIITNENKMYLFYTRKLISRDPNHKYNYIKYYNKENNTFYLKKICDDTIITNINVIQNINKKSQEGLYDVQIDFESFFDSGNFETFANIRTFLLENGAL